MIIYAASYKQAAIPSVPTPQPRSATILPAMSPYLLSAWKCDQTNSL